MNTTEWLEKNTFYCERMHARIRPQTCIANQQMVRSGEADRRHLMAGVACINCPQGRAIMEQQQKNTTPAEKQQGRCHVCGKEFEPYRHGASTVRRVCRECLAGKFRDQKLQQKQQKSNDDNIIVLNMSRYPNLCELLKQDAEEHFRTPEAQILWIVNTYYKHLRGQRAGGVK